MATEKEKDKMTLKEEVAVRQPRAPEAADFATREEKAEAVAPKGEGAEKVRVRKKAPYLATLVTLEDGTPIVGFSAEIPRRDFERLKEAGIVEELEGEGK